MTPELLSGIVGIAISLALSYIPGLHKKWEMVDGDYKRAVVGLLLVCTAAAVYGLSCTNWLDIGLTCDRSGLWQVGKNLIAALVSNQSVFVLTHKVKQN